MTKAEVMAQKLRAFKCRNMIVAGLKSPPVTQLIARGGGRRIGQTNHLTEISKLEPGSVLLRKADLRSDRIKFLISHDVKPYNTKTFTYEEARQQIHGFLAKKQETPSD